MPDCYATGCRNRATDCRKNKKQLQWESYHGKISFHRIPKEPETRRKWLEEMGLDPDGVPETLALCSQHFEEKHLDRTSLVCTRLRPGAVPSKYKATMKDDEPPLKQCKVLDNDQIDLRDCNIGKSTDGTDRVERDGSTCQGSTLVLRVISDAPCLSEDPPRKKILRVALQNIKIMCRRRIKIIQQKQRRDMKRIAKLKKALISLRQKNQLIAEQLDIINDMGNSNEQFV